MSYIQFYLPLLTICHIDSSCPLRSYLMPRSIPPYFCLFHSSLPLNKLRLRLFPSFFSLYMSTDSMLLLPQDSHNHMECCFHTICMAVAFSLLQHKVSYHFHLLWIICLYSQCQTRCLQYLWLQPFPKTVFFFHPSIFRESSYSHYAIFQYFSNILQYPMSHFQSLQAVPGLLHQRQAISYLTCYLLFCHIRLMLYKIFLL